MPRVLLKRWHGFTLIEAKGFSNDKSPSNPLVFLFGLFFPRSFFCTTFFSLVFWYNILQSVAGLTLVLLLEPYAIPRIIFEQ